MSEGINTDITLIHIRLFFNNVLVLEDTTLNSLNVVNEKPMFVDMYNYVCYMMENVIIRRVFLQSAHIF